MATHFSTLAWSIPWTEEPGGLQSMRSQTVGHDLVSKQKQFVIEEKNSAICRDMVWLSNYETVIQSEVSPKEKKHHKSGKMIQMSTLPSRNKLIDVENKHGKQGGVQEGGISLEIGIHIYIYGFPGGSKRKESACNAGDPG